MITTYRRLTAAEWVKLRSLKSTGWTLFAMVVSSLALTSIACALMRGHYQHTDAAFRATWDPTNQSLIGTLTGQVAVAVLGVLAITAEFSSGTIRATIAAAPRRGRVTVAKAAAYGAVALLTGEVASFASFFVGQALMSGGAPTAALGDSGVFRAVALTGRVAGMNRAANPS